MEIAEFFRHKLANGWVFDPETVYVTWGIMLLATVGFFLLRRQIATVPSSIQSMAEMVIDFFDKQVVDMMGPKGKKYTSLIFFIFFAVLLFNWTGLLPGDLCLVLKEGSAEHGKHFLILAPPTRDINTTLALALCSFMLFNFFGLKEKGLKYLAHFIEPAPEVAKSLPPYLLPLVVPLTLLFVMLNIMELFARVLSLTVRLFCNIMGEHIVAASLILFTIVVFNLLMPFNAAVAYLGGAVTFLLPLFVYLLGVFTGAVQAFVFAILTLSYISIAVAEEH